MSVAAHLLADASGDDLKNAVGFANGEGDIKCYDEIWVHSCWLPSVLKSCLRVIRSGKLLVCMPHGNLDPVRLHYSMWKKCFVGPFERWVLRHAARVVATCGEEYEWIRGYEPRIKEIETISLKRFFSFPAEPIKAGNANHLLYLGREHPLKGIEYLKAAVRSIPTIELRILSQTTGEEKEAAWRWCDVLILPTLSENFGLVVAEALERGKRVITTDGAPVWGDGNTYGNRLIYLRGYRDGTPANRVAMLKDAIQSLVINR